MRKIYVLFYGVLFTLVLIVFIGMYGVLKIKEPAMADINKSILNTADLTNMTEGDYKKLRQLYYINKTEVEDYILYAPKTNMDANEILVVKASNEECVDMLKKKIEARVDKQSDSFKDYRPELKLVIDNYKLEEKGQYLYLIISKENEKINKALNKNFR